MSARVVYSHILHKQRDISSHVESCFWPTGERRSPVLVVLLATWCPSKEDSFSLAAKRSPSPGSCWHFLSVASSCRVPVSTQEQVGMLKCCMELRGRRGKGIRGLLIIANPSINIYHSHFDLSLATAHPLASLLNCGSPLVLSALS